MTEPLFTSPPDWVSWSFILLVVLTCLVVSAFVSGSEIAFFGLTHGDIDELEESGDPRHARILALLEDPERLLATILISNNLVNITMVVLLTFALSQVVHFQSVAVEFMVQTVFMTFLLLLFGEILPKLAARSRMLKWVETAVPGVEFLYRILGPFAKAMARTTGVVNRLVTKKQENISTEELETALGISDVTEGEEKEMLEGILTFGEREAREIMISRVDVTAIDIHDSWEQAMAVILESGYSRIPVYDNNQDSIRGILYGKDLLPYIGKKERPAWQSLIREAYFVPESRMLDDLLEDFRKRKIHIAIVVDEYGGTRGIVTLEDIIEEIVGDIDDEFDETDRMYSRIGPDAYIFEAKIPLPDFYRITGVDEESQPETGDAESLAGLILEIKGDFPKVDEPIEWPPFRFSVLEMERHRIASVKVEVQK